MNLSGQAFGLSVPEASPWKTPREFIACARPNPGKIMVGASGAGGSGHFATHLLDPKSANELDRN